MVRRQDPHGAALFIGGDFVSAGGVRAYNVARWNGRQWSAVGAGLDGAVTTLVSFDDGGGPALFAMGAFNFSGTQFVQGLARWDGTHWVSVAPNPTASGGNLQAKLAVFDDGSGPALYLGGSFFLGAQQHNIARLRQGAWEAVGGGVNGVVIALSVFDDGSGPRLFVGGNFTQAGGAPHGYLAAWNGSAWMAVGGGLNGPVRALVEHDETGLRSLAVGGFFTTAGGAPANRVALWDGSLWRDLGTGLDASPGVYSLASIEDGGAPALFAGLGGAPGIARWDGASWSTPDGGAEGTVTVMTTHDFGEGQRLVIGGLVSRVGSLPASRIAVWDPPHWRLPPGGFGNRLFALARFDDGGGDKLYAGGFAGSVEGAAMNCLAAWDGRTWSDVGGGVRGGPAEALATNALIEHDDGQGPALFVGGFFTTAGDRAASNIARWNGAAWSALADGVNGRVRAFAEFDDGGGPALYVGGDFSHASAVALNGVARWNGAAWSPLGAGLQGFVYRAHALAVYDDGSGPALFVGGAFSSAGNVTGQHLARWNGSAWSSVGPAPSWLVYALTVADLGAGPVLIAAGGFAQIGGINARSIARWNGYDWAPLGAGLSGTVLSVREVDLGNGRELFAGGSFGPTLNQVSALLARWNGTQWSELDLLPPLPTNVDNNYVQALLGFDDGSGDALYVAGGFTTNPSGDSFLARWGCEPAPRPFCLRQAPSASNGCQSQLSASAHPSVDHTSPCLLVANEVEGQRTGIFFYGVNGAFDQPWCANGSSRLCIVGPRQRLNAISTGGYAGQCDGVLSADWSAFQLTNPSALGAPWSAGAVAHVQGWFRDPLACRTASLTPGVRLVFQP